MNYKRPSTFFVEDGSYLRCKLLQIGYTLPKRWTKNIGLRLSFSAQNPFTITKYSGMDPEAASLGKEGKVWNPVLTGQDILIRALIFLD